MGTCTKCRRTSEKIADVLSLCADCIRKADNACLAGLKQIHEQSRLKFNLPSQPPIDLEGIECGLCRNKCSIPAGGRGYCGVRRNESGQLKGGTPEAAAVSWYHDPLPTNCVADWVCPGGSNTGYPKWANHQGPEFEFENLAVFYEACTFKAIAAFIAEQNPKIPYALLGFHGVL